jgi:hypothetical protein
MSVETVALARTPAPTLRLSVQCSTSRGGAGVPHDVVLHPDWTLDMPHDLEAERIAVAFGGYLTCVDLADRVVPASREWLALQLREQLPRLVRQSKHRWFVVMPAECCVSGFTDVAEAALHSRSVAHLATTYSTAELEVRRLTSEIARALGIPKGGLDLPDERALRAVHCVRSADALRRLWYAGIAPEVVARIHEAVNARSARLPQEFYLGAVTRRPDLAWVAESAAAQPPVPEEEPDEDTLTWLVWTETALDREDRAARGAWLRLGVPRGMVLELCAAGYKPADVELLSNALGRSPATAASVLMSWVSAGLRPETTRLVEFVEAGVPDLHISGPAVRRLLAEARYLGGDLGDETAAELIVVWRNVPEALTCARFGTSDPVVLARNLYRRSRSEQFANRGTDA